MSVCVGMSQHFEHVAWSSRREMEFTNI